jgi:DNA-binding MarR family transcriptional regulator
MPELVDDTTLSADGVLELLYRRDVAIGRHRAALGRLLGLADAETLAVIHLAHGELTTARIAVLLGLSSGGATAFVQRLERLGHVKRRAHPRDQRSSLISLTAATRVKVEHAEASLGAGLERVTAGLDPSAQAAVAGFLAAVVELSEALTDDPAAERTRRRGVLQRPVPSRWG